MNGSNTLQNNIQPWRIWIFIIIIGIIFVVYAARLVNLQVLQFNSYSQQAEENRTSEINTPALRGIIYDRNGIVLARNIPSFNIALTQADLPDDTGEVQEIFRQVSQLTGVPVSAGEISETNPYVPCTSEHGIVQIAEYGRESYPFQPVLLACDVPRDVAMIAQENASHWPGISVETVPVRDYPTGALTANLIGFLGPIPANDEARYVALGFVPNRDKVGYSGVELSFQDILAGKNGVRLVGRDVAGKYLPDIQPPVAATPGENIRLTIDTRLQQAATAVLEDEINGWNLWLGEERMTSGAVIAMNPKTGEILAMVSYPTYENNRMARFIPTYYYQQLLADKREPLYNRAIYAELPAGSVFKLVTATGVLNEGVVSPDKIIETPGKIVISEKSFFPGIPPRTREFIDWIYRTTPAGFGELDFVHAVANSSNVYFYKVGGGFEDEVSPGLGICRLGTYARALGFGEMPGIELQDKSDGLIPDPDWKRLNQGEGWTLGDTYIMSVGQGYALATPLQVLMSAATIANDGKLMEPTILHDVLDSNGNIIQAFEPKMRWDLTEEAEIEEYVDNTIRGCRTTGNKKTIQPWVFPKIREGMHLAVTEGTLKNIFSKGDWPSMNIAAAGKTGTAEYCDEWVNKKGLCIPGSWPTHAWTLAFAPYEDPEIAVVAFVYNGGEGATVAGPVVRRVLEAYFNLKQTDKELAP